MVPERFLHVGVDHRHETLLFLAILCLDLQIFDFEDPPNDRKILKIMVIEILIDVEVLTEIMGPLQKIEISVVLLEGLLPELTFILLGLLLL